MQELSDDLQAAQESARAARGQESGLKEEANRLNQELQKSQRLQRRLQSEKEAQEQDIQELQKQIKRLRGALQVSRTAPPPGGGQPSVTGPACFFDVGVKSSQGFRSEPIRHFRLEMSRERVVLLPVERRHKLIASANCGGGGFTKGSFHPVLLNTGRSTGRHTAGRPTSLPDVFARRYFTDRTAWKPKKSPCVFFGLRVLFHTCLDLKSKYL